MKAYISAALTVLLVFSGCANLNIPQLSEEYTGTYFKVQVPRDFTVLDISEGDYAAFESPDKSVVFAVYSPIWTGEGNEIFIQDNETEIDKEVQSFRNDQAELGPGSTEIDTYITFEAKDKSYKRSVVEIMYENYGSRTQRIFSYQYKDTQSYDKYYNEYLKFKESLVQYAD